MFNYTPCNSSISKDINLEVLTKLLAEKYLNVEVENVSTIADNQIKVVLLNGRHGLHDGIDEENERPIQYLKTFNAHVEKEAAEYSYWSNSVITFSASQLKSIIDGLKAMATPNRDNNLGKLRAMC